MMLPRLLEMLLMNWMMLLWR